MTTLTRARLTEALTGLDRPDIAAALYARRLPGAAPGASGAVALDYDDPADLALFVLALHFAGCAPWDIADVRTGQGAHPSDRAPSAAWWPSIRFSEATAEQWADEVRTCLVCREGDDHGVECGTHAVPPWGPTPYGADRATVSIP